MATDILQPLAQPLEQFLALAMGFLPNILFSAVLLAIGWVIGTIVGRLTKELMLKFSVDSYISRRHTMFRLSDILPVAFEWVIYILFIRAAVSLLGIPALSNFMETLVMFLPRLIGSILVVVIGYVIAEYVKGEIDKSRIAYSDVMGNVIFWMMVYVAIALALPLVGINPELVNNILLIIVGSIGIGIAIALGLGLKDVVRDIARKKARHLMR